MAVHWIGAKGNCKGRLLDGATCLTGTPVYPTSDAKMVVEVVEDYEYRVRRFLLFRGIKEDTRSAIDSLKINKPDGNGHLRPKSPWGLPGPSANNPKGERTFRVPFTDQSGTEHLGNIIKSSGLGTFNWTEFTKRSDVTAGFKVAVPGHISAGTDIHIEPNSSITMTGVFTAAIDPEVDVELLLPGNGLEGYMRNYLRWMAGEAADQGELGGIVEELVPNSSRSGFEASVEPERFNIPNALGWQDIAVTINTGESATFLAALRFRAKSGEECVTDLMSVSTSVEPAFTEEPGVLFRDFRRWRWGGGWPSRFGFGPIIWEPTQEPSSEGEGESSTSS